MDVIGVVLLGGILLSSGLVEFIEAVLPGGRLVETIEAVPVDFFLFSSVDVLIESVAGVVFPVKKESVGLAVPSELKVSLLSLSSAVVEVSTPKLSRLIVEISPNVVAVSS
jgi:hypothetical protein